MIRVILLFLTITMTILPIQGQKLGDLVGKAKKVLSGEKLTDEEIGAGLKEALSIGTGEAVDFLSVEDGYYKSIYKIALPEEVQSIVSRLSMVPGFHDLESNLVERMNRGAELAAAKAKPIFLSTIKNLSFKDVMQILTGERDAATRYLESTTYDQLYTEFRPIIKSALDEVKATDLWREAVTAYNKLPLVRQTNPELDDHVTDKALVGMFSLIERKEEGIRSDVSQRSTDLLRRVFAEQDR